MDAYTVLIETARPEEVEAVRRALGEAEIPFRSGLLADEPPRVVFSVPRDRVALARAAVLEHVPVDDWIEDRDGDPSPSRARTGSVRGARRPTEVRVADGIEFGTPSATRRALTAEEAMDGLDEILGEALGLVATDVDDRDGGGSGDRLRSGPTADGRVRDDDPTEVSGDGEEQRARFPARSFGIAASLVAVHVALVFVTGGAFDAGRDLFEAGVLLRGSTLFEPWRLIGSLVLHADLRHALANGMSMIVFAVPLLERIGPARTAGIYLASGIGGGFTALSLARDGQAFVGSSGAVAGLFGAWAVLAFERAGRADLPGRARIRTLGVALLVVPSLLTPFTPDGRPVSVASHVGGLVTGMIVGAVLSGLAARLQGDDPLFDG